MARPMFRKPEMGRFAMMFAEMKLKRPSATVEDISAMTATQEWQEAAPFKRGEVAKELESMTRAMLIEAGYNRETVYKKIP